jgi:Carboxypeptidase regulatory-like domain/TonB-dependent Receptor Plug Domain
VGFCPADLSVRATCALALILLTSICFGQQQPDTDRNKVSLSGTVRDRNKAVVPGAKISLNYAGIATLVTESDDNGSFSFVNILAGTYTVSVTTPNLGEKSYQNINLAPGLELKLNVTLEPVSAKSESSSAVAAQEEGSAHLKTESGKGAISGTVTDQTQAVVVGAKVSLTTAAGTKLETQSDVKGWYSFTNLSPDTYNLSATAPNFSIKSFDDIGITAGLELTLDLSLQPAGEKTEVNVESSNVGKVETETSTVSGTITATEVVSLQLNGRNFSQLIALAPGVSNQTGQDEGKVGVLGSVKYSVNGGRVEYNSFEIDGSDVLNTGLNGASSTLMVYPSLDAIQEVKVLTSNYGAQYGRTASGTTQVTTKSGTPKFHGNLYDFVRNEAFNSRNFFDFTSKAPLYRRQDFGGTIGGPFYVPGLFNTKKDKTFFFFSEEARLEKSPVDYNEAVPGLKERGLIMTSQGVQQNLSAPSALTGAMAQVFDFSDVCPLPGQISGTFSRQQYPDCPGILESDGWHILGNSLGLPNALLSAGDIGTPVADKNAITILNANLIPLPNSPFGCNYTLPLGTLLDPSDPYRCYVASVSPSTYWREELFRVDQELTPKLRASFRYVHDAWDTTVLAPQWSYLSMTDPSAATFPTIQNRFIGPGLNLVGRLTQTISPTLLNVIDISYTNATITLTDQNGPGGARFQRDPSLSQPLVADPANPGQCNPTISVQPPVDFGTPTPECGMGYLFNNGFGGKMPGVAILGTNAAYGGRGFAFDPSFMPWGHTDPTYAIRDDIGKTVGKHTLQLGAQYVFSERNQTNNAIGAASGDMQGLLTFSNLAQSSGNAFEDFLAGNIQNFTQDSAQSRYYQRYQIAEPYIQDDWKIRDRLTINLGLRLSLFGTYHEKNHHAWNWESSRFNGTAFTVDPIYGELLYNDSPLTLSSFQSNSSVTSDLGLVQCGVSNTPTGCMSGHLFNWAPRIGFAWDPKGDGKTAVRAGYGIFYEHGTGNEANTGSLEASAPVVLSVTQPLPISYPCIGNIGYGPTFNPTSEPCEKENVTPPPSGSLYPIDVTSIPTHAIWPYAQQWSFGVQHELPNDLVANVAYVGSKGTHLTVERQLNQRLALPVSENPFGPNEPLTLSDCTTPPTGISGHPGDGSTAFQLLSGTLVSPNNPAYVYLQAACENQFIPNVNSLPGRPYPGLGRVLALQNVANSSYHALQLTLQRTRGPLTGGISYTYSHSIDDSSDRSDPVLVDSYDLAENRASSSFDERHLLNINYIYQFSLKNIPRHFGDWANAREPENDAPTSKCCSAFVDSLLDKWEFSGITLFQSGTPFTVINTVGNTGISVTDNAGVSSGLGIASSYPDIVHGWQSNPGGNPQSFGPLLQNPSQYVAPRGLTFGDAGRNFANNPSRLNFDMALAKRFKVMESGQLEFRAEAFNIFNRTQFRIYDPDNPSGTGNNVISCYAGPTYSAGFAGSSANCVTGASFLHPIDAHRPRTVQFGFKFSF